ncbi:hypothetical protein NDU88_003514 [Pleurodeles waltl]|uniref:Uncharacterized protein n=1 Tax=Pleurodeles waltl TaxID=8319 RepID=A0AAV7SDU5_PLEWA|nr:hypothetical protein NDU88_003514 [Pleurodeles waltl]
MPAGTPQEAPHLYQFSAQDREGFPPHLSEESAESHVLVPPSRRHGPPCVATNPRLRWPHPAVTSLATSLSLQTQPTSLASCWAAQPFQATAQSTSGASILFSLGAVHFASQLCPFCRPSRPLSSSLPGRHTYGPLWSTSPSRPPFCSRQPR